MAQLGWPGKILGKGQEFQANSVPLGPSHVSHGVMGKNKLSEKTKITEKKELDEWCPVHGEKRAGAGDMKSC